MRRTLLLLATMAVLFCPVARAQTRVNAGISVGDQGLHGFYLAIGNAYHVPERQVMVMRERSIPDDELPVVFFLAQRARVDPGVIVELRLRGMSWYDITTHFGLGSEIYYYRPVRQLRGPTPYGRAFGHYRQHPEKQWRRMRLADEDIVNLVNLRFAAEHGHMNATQVSGRGKVAARFNTIYSDSRTGPRPGRPPRQLGPGQQRRGQRPGRDQGQGQGPGARTGAWKREWTELTIHDLAGPPSGPLKPAASSFGMFRVLTRGISGSPWRPRRGTRAVDAESPHFAGTRDDRSVRPKLWIDDIPIVPATSCPDAGSKKGASLSQRRRLLWHDRRFLPVRCRSPVHDVAARIRAGFHPPHCPNRDCDFYRAGPAGGTGAPAGTAGLPITHASRGSSAVTAAATSPPAPSRPPTGSAIEPSSRASPTTPSTDRACARSVASSTSLMPPRGDTSPAPAGTASSSTANSSSPTASRSHSSSTASRAAQAEERQGAEPRMGLHGAPLVLVEARGLVEDLVRHTRLAEVVHQRRHAEVVQLQPAQAELLAQRYGEDAHVHRMGERVLVVVADRRRPTIEVSLLSTWSTIICTARFTFLAPLARPIRMLVITSRVTATPWA